MSRSGAGSAESALARAELLIDLSRPEEALAILRPAVADDPTHVKALCLAARAELGLKHPDQAVSYARQARSSAPDAEWPLRLLALGLRAQGRFDEALSAAEAAVQAAPHAWQTHHTVAFVAGGRVGHIQVAWSAAHRAVQLAPEVADTHALMGQIALPVAPDVADQALREALRLNPDHAIARNDLGRLRLQRADPMGAAVHFAGAMASDVGLDVAVGNIDVSFAEAGRRLLYFVLLGLVLIAAFGEEGGSRGGWSWGGLSVALVAVGVAWVGRGMARALQRSPVAYLRGLRRRAPYIALFWTCLVGSALAVLVSAAIPPGPARETPLELGFALLFLGAVICYTRGVKRWLREAAGRLRGHD